MSVRFFLVGFRPGRRRARACARARVRVSVRSVCVCACELLFFLYYECFDVSGIGADIARVGAELAGLVQEQSALPVCTPHASTYACRQFGLHARRHVAS